MSATPFKQGGDGGRYSGIVTTTTEYRSCEKRTLYVGGDYATDGGNIWIQIGTNCDDLGLIDPNPNENGGVVCMSLDDAQGLAIELLSRIRKIKEDAGNQ